MQMLEVEYRDGYEEVFALSAGVGYDVARVPTSSPEGSALRRELHQLAKRRSRLTVGGVQYDIRCLVYDSFGEEVFRIEVHRV